MGYNYHDTHFSVSISKTYHLPNDEKKTNKEIAFIGYSNSGKSSVINALTSQKKLTKVSKTPGCTRLINLFEIKPNIRIIDFPGYGYCKTIPLKKKYWNDAICQYLKKRKNLKGLVLIMDIRHTIKNLDQIIIKNALSTNVPVLILLNKADKISKNILQNKFTKIEQKIKISFTSYIQVELFSATKKYGVKSLKKILNHWLK